MGTENPGPTHTPSGPLRFGPYWLDKRIAVGGTAEVYLARPVDPKSEPQRLVVKRLLPYFALDREGRTMFEREARLHAAVEHANVVTVFGAGKNDDGEPFLAMEYIEGCDAYRLLRRLKQEGQSLGVPLSVFIACEVLRALASVHGARDASHKPLGIIHRDVTPSNLYLSRDGHVKLGDFGIARSTTRTSLRTEQSAVLKGKFAYLAPEQVAGEHFDHRADLFSLASVLAEMFMGKPLFPGGGQLAVLLAIRDCRVDALEEVRARLAPPLFKALERALARDPAKRFQSALDFSAALAPFEPEARDARKELAKKVGWVLQHTSSGTLPAVEVAKRIASAPSVLAVNEDTNDPFDRRTVEYTQIPSYVFTRNGERFGPWTFARLVEAVATGQLGRGDAIDFMGRGRAPIEDIEDLARLLPASSIRSKELPTPTKPDLSHEISAPHLLEVLLKILESKQTGVLFAERAAVASGTDSARKELYFLKGKLHSVASSNASELLGEYLVRRGQLSREELDVALAVLPRYGGRIGDTLISLGLVGPVDIFRAIREQGRDRVTDLFLWKEGTLRFFISESTPPAEFPLDLDLPTLMIAGLEAAYPGNMPLELFRARLDETVTPANAKNIELARVNWPMLVSRVLAAASRPLSLRALLKETTRTGTLSAGDVLRAVQLLVAAKLVTLGSTA